MNNQEAVDLCKLVRTELTDWYDNRVRKLFESERDKGISEVMSMRGYTRPAMRKTLEDVGLVHIYNTPDLEVLTKISDYTTYKLWGLYSEESGKAIYTNRYVVPIRDISGQVTALVGWYPDSRKYITTKTYGFRRSAQFFNAEYYKQYLEDRQRGQGTEFVILVEGIFDTLAVRSLGISALGNMGLPLSAVKVEQLRRYSSVMLIPDGDKAGKSVLPVMVSNKKKTWNVENVHSYVSLKLPNCKDMDDFINKSDNDEYIREVLTRIPKTGGLITLGV